MFKFLLILLTIQIVSADSVITPIPLSNSYDLKKSHLGKKLFFDTRVSKDNSIACVSCHQLPEGGADVVPYSFGVNGQQGAMNSPTVLNSLYNFVQFWDGRATSLEEQAKGPIENPVEMANSMENVTKMVKNDNFYKKEFLAIYPDGVTEENILNALAQFEKALTTPNSRFDKYLRGDKKALNTQELKGWKRFNDLGCISCHNGINIGANMYQKAGLIIPMEDKDSLGRYNVTKREIDKFVFKVPTLRNIALTAPYFHNGSVKRLDKAIYQMAYHQLGIIIKHKDIEEIKAFLKTLTGETPEILQKD
jgi:cytochrome c peroxidase